MEDINKELKKIKDLMAENLESSRAIQTDTKQLRRYFVFLQAISLIKLILIIAPIILALIYLPPLVMRLIDSYQGVFHEIDQLKQVL